MIQQLQTLTAIMQKNIILERKEVIKRYRSLKNFNAEMLRLLCMTEFFMLYRNEKGEISMI